MGVDPSAIRERQVAFEVIGQVASGLRRCGHVLERASSAAVEPSSSFSCSRSAWRARWMRDLTVPSAMPKHLGDLAVGETLDVVEDDRHPQRRATARRAPPRTCPRARAPCVASSGLRGALGRSSPASWRVFSLSTRARPRPERAAPIERGVGGDAIDEGREARLGPEAMAVTVETQEGLLGQVLGVFLVPHHAIEKSVDAPTRGDGSALRRRLLVPGLPPQHDEVAIGIFDRRRAARWPRLAPAGPCHSPWALSRRSS